LLTGCNFPKAQPLPTLLPESLIPTAIAQTAQALNTAWATQTILAPSTAKPTKAPPTIEPSQQATQPLATLTPTPTETPQESTATPQTDLKPPAGLPNAVIQILNPGPGSRVVSPITVRTNVKLDQKSVLRIELVGEDGRLLMREVRSYNPDKPETLMIGTEVGFELPGVAENGRVQILLEDSKGRIASVNSVDLLLLALGDSELNDASDTFEDIVIQAPRAKALIQGGSVRVTGLARMHSSQPLLIELETSDGKIVGARQVAVTPIPGSTHGTFEIDIPYQVSSATNVRVKVWEPSEKIPGILHLSSVEVLLSP